MSVINAMGLSLAMVAGIYLVVALLKPEKFQ